jgi:SAM-dependent methyltransferase
VALKRDIFLPNHTTPISEENVWKWYCNIAEELKDDFLSEGDKEYLTAYYREAGLLRPWRRPFFKHHYSRSFTYAAQHLLKSCAEPQILDLGCGTGTQALLLSILGAKVTGIDMDEKALSILEKRRSFYEDALGRRLYLKVSAINALDFDYGSIAPIHGIYSMFAFNMMQPSATLLKRLMSCTADDCSIGILDGNRTSWLPKLVAGRHRAGCLSPIEIEQALKEYQFETINHQAGFAVPPICWCLAPSYILRPVDRFLGNFWFMAISHQILSRKQIGI